MMPKALPRLIAAIVLATLASACAPATSQPGESASDGEQAATFIRYEDTTPLTLLTPEEIDRREAAGEPTIQINPDDGKTGFAFIRLNDGTEIRANCPIQGLVGEQSVTVRMNADGSWVVLR